MDLENLTIQDLVKIEGFAERCQVARRYPLVMMMITLQRDRTLLEVVDKLPSVLVRDEEQFIARLAGFEIEGEQNVPAKKVEVKPAAAPAAKAEEQKPVVESASAPDAAKAAVKPAAKPADGNRGAGRPPKVAAIPAGDMPDFDKLSKQELRDFCVKNSVISRVKKDMGNSKHESMVAWCKQHFSASAVAPAAEPPSPYEGLSAKELYCLCKERGLTVGEKQPVETYKEALFSDDMAREAHEAKEREAAEAKEAAEPEEKEAVPDITAVPVPEAEEKDEEFDDWDDAGATVVPAKEQEPAAAADDDDDDWDI